MLRNSILCLFILSLFTGCQSDLNKRLDIVEMDELWRNGELLKAKEVTEQYLAKTQENELAWTMLGHIESDLDQDSLAVVAYNKALDVNPNTVEAITGLGIISRKKGDLNEASDYYYEAIRIDPDYAEAYSSLVVINLKQKKFDEAVEVGLKGYELSKSNGVIAANLATAYHYVNDTINREKYFNIAKKNGYKNAATLELVFSGELTIFD